MARSTLGHNYSMGTRSNGSSTKTSRVRLHGDVVVAQVRCHQRGTDLTTGGQWAMVFRYTDVWLRTPAGWRIDVRQATGRPWTEAEDGRQYAAD